MRSAGALNSDLEVPGGESFAAGMVPRASQAGNRATGGLNCWLAECLDEVRLCNHRRRVIWYAVLLPLWRGPDSFLKGHADYAAAWRLARGFTPNHRYPRTPQSVVVDWRAGERGPGWQPGVPVPWSVSLTLSPDPS